MPLPIFLFVTKEVAQDYFVRSINFDHVGDGMSLLLPTSIWNVLSPFGFYKVIGRIRMHPVLVVFALYCETDIDWSLAGGSDNVLAYDFFSDTVQCYRVEKIPEVKRQKTNAGPAVAIMVPAVHVN